MEACDLCIIGAGYTGLGALDAATKYLSPGSRVVVVDRGYRWGGHWGGGMWINALDHARFGYLFLRNGQWSGKRIISEKWIEMARAPGPANLRYGYMNWFLNTRLDSNGKTTLDIPAAPESVVTFRGAGSNIIYIDWENDLVAVVRWIDRRHFNEFIEKLLAAIKD